MSRSLGDTIYNYYNQSSYNIYSYPKTSPPLSRSAQRTPTTASEPTTRQREDEHDTRIDEPAEDSVEISFHQPSLVHSPIIGPTEQIQVLTTPAPKERLEGDDAEMEHASKDIFSAGKEMRKLKRTLISGISSEVIGKPAGVSNDANVESDYTDEMAEEALQTPSIDEYSSSSTSSDDSKVDDDSVPKRKLGDDKGGTFGPASLVSLYGIPRELKSATQNNQTRSRSDEEYIESEHSQEEEANDSKGVVGESIPDQKQEPIEMEISKDLAQLIQPRSQSDEESYESERSAQVEANGSENLLGENIPYQEDSARMENFATGSRDYSSSETDDELEVEENAEDSSASENHSDENDESEGSSSDDVRAMEAAMLLQGDRSDQENLTKLSKEQGTSKAKEQEATGLNENDELTAPSPNPTSCVDVSQEATLETPSHSASKKRKKQMTPAEFFSSFSAPKKQRPLTPAEFFEAIPLPRFLQEKVDSEMKRKRMKVRRSLARRRKAISEARDDR